MMAPSIEEGGIHNSAETYLDPHFDGAIVLPTDEFNLFYASIEEQVGTTLSTRERFLWGSYANAWAEWRQCYGDLRSPEAERCASTCKKIRQELRNEHRMVAVNEVILNALKAITPASGQTE